MIEDGEYRLGIILVSYCYILISFIQFGVYVFGLQRSFWLIDKLIF